MTSTQFGTDGSAKTFYRRLFGFLIQQDDIKVVESAIRDVFMLVYNRNLSKDMAILQRNLKSITRTHTIESIYISNITSPDDQQIPDSLFNVKSEFYQWIANITEEQKEEAKSAPRNQKDASLYDASLYDASLVSNDYCAPKIAETLTSNGTGFAFYADSPKLRMLIDNSLD